jgi:hypothetical protein
MSDSVSRYWSDGERVDAARGKVIYLSQMEEPDGEAAWDRFLESCVVGGEDLAALWVAFPHGRAQGVGRSLDYILYGVGGFARAGARSLSRHYGRGLSGLVRVYDELLDLNVGEEYVGLLALVEGVSIRLQVEKTMIVKERGLSIVAGLARKYLDDKYAMAMLSTFTVQEARLGGVTSEAELRARYDRVERCVATMVREGCVEVGG